MSLPIDPAIHCGGICSRLPNSQIVGCEKIGYSKAIVHYAKDIHSGMGCWSRVFTRPDNVLMERPVNCRSWEVSESSQAWRAVLD